MNTNSELMENGLRQISLPGESWKLLSVRYAVSTMGRIATFGKHLRPDCKFHSIPSIMKPAKDARGYLRTVMDGATIKVHRVIAEAFIPNPENHATVNHKNCIKTDNRVGNLEWMTHADNVRHGAANGRLIPMRGSRNGHSKLKEEQVLKIIQLSRETNMTRKEIAALWDNVTVLDIKEIRAGKKWKHLQ